MQSVCRFLGLPVRLSLAQAKMAASLGACWAWLRKARIVASFSDRTPPLVHLGDGPPTAVQQGLRCQGVEGLN